MIDDDYADEDFVPKWEVWPNPYDHEVDYFFTDDDKTALAAIMRAADNLYHDIEPGGTLTLKVKMTRA